MNFAAAIFDLDGTLLNSMDIWEEINAEFLAKRGLKIPKNYCADICARSFEEAALYTIKSAKNTGMTVFGVYDKDSKKDEKIIKSIAGGYLYDFSNAPLPIARGK